LITVNNGSPFVLNKTSGNLTGYTVTANLTWTGAQICPNAAYNLTILNITTLAGTPLYSNFTYKVLESRNVSTSGVNGSIGIAEVSGNSINITFENGDIPSLGVDTTLNENQIQNTGETHYTSDYGTLLTRDSTSQISIVYPDTYRIGKASLGQTGTKEYTLTNGQYDTDLDVTLKSSSGSSETVKDIDVGLAKLDSEVVTGSLDKPIVLLGGPGANLLVKDLVTANKVNMSAVTSNRALVQLVSDAFNGKSALVIAGYSGDDTRLAAQVVASQVLGNPMGLAGDSKILNTGVSSYSLVTVI
jgi:hypothetical protein